MYININAAIAWHLFFFVTRSIGRSIGNYRCISWEKNASELLGFTMSRGTSYIISIVTNYRVGVKLAPPPPPLSLYNHIFGAHIVGSILILY